MRKSAASNDARALFHSLASGYGATPTNLKIIDLYILFAIITAVIQFTWLLLDRFHSIPFFLVCFHVVGTAVLAVSLRIQVNKENKESKDLPPEWAFADFVLCNLVLHLVIMNFMG